MNTLAVSTTPMTRRPAALRRSFWLLGLAAAALLAGCERPPITATQNGWRGTGMDQITNPRTAKVVAAANKLPDPVPAIPDGGAPAREAFKNVQVLGDLNAGQFTRTMLAITAWVAPKEGCNYCHAAGEDLSSDKLYTKVVARKMLAMTRTINNDWSQHVAATGVTCYTCHRGQPVPSQVWFTNPGPKRAGGASADNAGQNHPAPLANLSSMAYDPLTPLLMDAQTIRVNSTTALPAGNKRNIKETETTYALMMHLSQSLGVNCTFCHNSRGFGNWNESPPQRQTAFHGINMVRTLNKDHLLPLTATFPANRRGPTGDVAKISCATCHQGVNKPLYGEPMAKDFPALGTPKAPAAAAAAAAAAPTAVAVPAADTVNTAAAAPAPAAAPEATAPAAPAAAADAVLGKVYFAPGKSELNPAGQGVVAQALKALQAEAGMKVVLSGFADSTGNADKNMELSKQRAKAVRDALQAGGVADARISLKKPEFVIGTGTAEARRVEILRAP